MLVFYFEYFVSQTFICKRLGPGQTRMDRPPYPGDLGRFIQEHYSHQAWQIWLDQQTKLINEHRLNPLDPRDRNTIEHAMRAFFV